MSTLLPLADLQTFLGLPAGTDEGLITAIADAVEEQFLIDGNRSARPFQDAQAGRQEVHDGEASPTLVLDYPIETVTSVVLGLDPANPDEVLDPADPNVLAWRAGMHSLRRVDGGLWGGSWFATYRHHLLRTGDPIPNYVHVTYDAQADLPKRAKQAIEIVVARIYRQLGSEDVSDERVSTYSRTLAKAYDAMWTAVARSCGRPRS